ncbi:hypothetical protein [Beutenbergia cavernae]|uniref:hypothetical protein n=1 Tax=Beutenbergia cavernae TaxID=84757 RepID=UPI00019ACE09|nr:hypothetical protein [Beutenbergia cavernae]
MALVNGLAPAVASPRTTDEIVDAALDSLARWASWSESAWIPAPRPGTGWFGSGYTVWGVQTNQKYTAAMATLATHARTPAGVDREWALDRALGSLRAGLDSHVARGGVCADGKPWGLTWISVLGLERMMHGIASLRPHLTDEDHAALHAVMCAEADWLSSDYQRGAVVGIVADLWDASARNHAESNIWNGAFLWRTAERYPQHPHAARWRDTSLTFLANGVSRASDLETADPEIRTRHRGANFFPHFAFDHHGYLNVGYMAICVSNAAIAQLDANVEGWSAPPLLVHGQRGLWAVLRRMIFGDGRLARVGGDSRTRYTYCQEYLAPALMYAAGEFGDPHAIPVLDRMLATLQRDQDASENGSFFGERLAGLAMRNPYYSTRLEGDRANALSLVAVHLPVLAPIERPAETLEEAVGGSWSEPDHGVVLHRSPRRFTSFAWRAHGLAAGLALPPGRGDLAEWDQNLGGRVRFAGDSAPDGRLSRELVAYRTQEFDGGFATSGEVVEGRSLALDESWTGEHAALSRLAFVALPDERTVVGFHRCTVGTWSPIVAELQGLHLGVPNDIFSPSTRQISTAQGMWAASAGEDDVRSLGQWACIDGVLGLVGVYGAPELQLVRHRGRLGGRFGSLHVDEVAFPLRHGPFRATPGSDLLDIGWIVVSDADASETAAVAGAAKEDTEVRSEGVRAIWVTGADGRRYFIAANLGTSRVRAPSAGSPLVSGSESGALSPGEIAVSVVDEVQVRPSASP